MVSRRVLGYSVLDGLAATLGHSNVGTEKLKRCGRRVYTIDARDSSRHLAFHHPHVTCPGTICATAREA